MRGRERERVGEKAKAVQGYLIHVERGAVVGFEEPRPEFMVEHDIDAYDLKGHARALLIQHAALSSCVSEETERERERGRER